MKAFLVLIIACVVLVGVSILADRTVHPSDYDKDETPVQNVVKEPAKEWPKATFEPGSIAVVDTNKGSFKFVMFEKDLPTTCKNFVSLANSGFYKGLIFHRVEDWVVQSGDPKGDGTGGSGKTIKLEIKSGLGFEVPYMVGMARKTDPNTATSQFFINKRSARELQGPQTGGYACFGLIFEGSNVIPKIMKKDVIKDIKITKPSAQDEPKIKEAIDKLAKAGHVSAGEAPVLAPALGKGSKNSH